MVYAVCLLSPGCGVLASGYGEHWERLLWKPSWGPLLAGISVSSAWVAPGCHKGLDPALLLAAPAVHPGVGGGHESAPFFKNKSSWVAREMQGLPPARTSWSCGLVSGRNGDSACLELSSAPSRAGLCKAALRCLPCRRRFSMGQS